MFAGSRVAWSEFRVGFSPRSTGASGARDFVALAAFFGLMMFLILLAWSVRDGLWGRIEQILLGALPQGQVPIRLGYHIDNTNKINVNILDAFAKRFPELTIVPQRTTDGEKGAVILPGLKVKLDPEGKLIEITGPWGKGKKDKRVTAFRLDAIPLDTPLWQWIRLRNAPAGTTPEPLPPASAPLLVAASRHLFEQHFRYDVYRESILADRLVPCRLKRMLPQTIARPDDLKHLVLEVKENITGPTGDRATTRSYHAFDVVWVDSFPTPDQTAMVMPLSTFELLLVSAENQLVAVHPEKPNGAGHDRVSQLRLMDIDLETAGIDEFRGFASCVGAAPVVPAQGDAEGDPTGNVVCPPLPPNGATKLAAPPLPASTSGACENLRERMPIKYPRILNNGQDLLVCTGEHRRLRDDEVEECGKAAGLYALREREPTFASRLEVKRALPGDAVAWLGPARVSVPCSAMSETDLKGVKAIAADRVAVEAAVAGAPPAAKDASVAEVERCEAWKAQKLSDTTTSPASVLILPSYQDVTIYRNPGIGRPFAWDNVPGEMRDMLRRSANREDAQSLNVLTGELLSWTTTLGRPGSAPSPVFTVDPAYESALVRFGVLSVIIEKVSTPLAAGGLALYLFLTSVILATAIAHRRRQYGLLMMMGTSPGKIAYIVSLQIVLSCIVGGALGAAAFLATSALVNALLAASRMVAEARFIIGLDVQSFLSPLTWPVVVALWVGMLFLAVAIGNLILRLQRVTTARAPIELVKS